MRMILFISSLLFLSASCSVEPEPINYGKDNCSHCEMAIMDNRYGSELVTDKGKIYKFDSVECLVEFLDSHKEGKEKYSLVLCTSFDQPGKLVDARDSYILHCKNLPSPMGMYLTAFDNEKSATSFQEKYSGKIYSWNDLVESFQGIQSNGTGK